MSLLQELAETVAETSLCALGKTASNPVLSTMKYFADEYAAHVDEKRCPAGVCKELIHYDILAEKCNGCGVCLKSCPHSAIKGEKKKVHAIEEQICRKCGICVTECKFDAIAVG
jgi:NADH-quinone oxidoreductase subunit F